MKRKSFLLSLLLSLIPVKLFAFRKNNKNPKEEHKNQIGPGIYWWRERPGDEEVKWKIVGVYTNFLDKCLWVTGVFYAYGIDGPLSGLEAKFPEGQWAIMKNPDNVINKEDFLIINQWELDLIETS